MNIMNGSLKGKVYESLEQKAELASAISDEKQRVYRVGFLEDKKTYTIDSPNEGYAEMKRS